MMITNPRDPQLGDAYTIDDIDGTWIVVYTASEQAKTYPNLAGTVRVQKIFDGAGPSELTTNVAIGRLRETPAHVPGTDGYAVALTAKNGTVVVPLHPEAYASPDQVCRDGDWTQRAAELPCDSHLVTYINGEWTHDEEYEPGVPDELLDQAAHDHTYYDDGETPVVGPCRLLSTCISSLLKIERIKQQQAGQPRFAQLDDVL